MLVGTRRRGSNEPTKFIDTEETEPAEIRLLIDRTILECCAICGVPELSDKISWRWSARLKRTLGKALYGTKLIKLASILKKSPVDLRAVVVHEIAHHISVYIHGQTTGRGHRSCWKSVMRTLGVRNPSMCTDVVSQEVYDAAVQRRSDRG